MTRALVALPILLAIALIAVAGLFSSQPPAAWRNFDYDRMTLGDLRAQIGDTFSQGTFKWAIGWTAERPPLRHHLIVFPDREETRIQSVHVDTWIDLPLYGGRRIFNEVVYQRRSP